MAKEAKRQLTDVQKTRLLKIRQEAVKAAKAAGKSWKQLPKEERVAFRKQAAQAERRLAKNEEQKRPLARRPRA